ncbi:MAG TPA: DUF4199 domain-containing protein [Pyrinomonadaceae bacterium]|nr:DUF4199 domain-containing protein [Pyrinomonadaceae bacterium]
MKKIVLIFGLISGALMAIFMFATIPFIDKIGFDKGLIVGYTSIVLAFILVFFGIRSYRENVNGGAVTFGRAFVIGILITLISSICYVIAWQILFHNFMPDFFDKYAAHVIEKARASGATPEAIQTQTQEMDQMKQLVKNPFFHNLFVFLEPFPVGLVITVISALILRKKSGRAKEDADGAGSLASSNA